MSRDDSSPNFDLHCELYIEDTGICAATMDKCNFCEVNKDEPR